MLVLLRVGTEVDREGITRVGSAEREEKVRLVEPRTLTVKE